MSDTDDDDFSLLNFSDPAIDGAAADSADSELEQAGLPRLLRYAVAARRHRPLLRQRLFAEIISVAPDLAEPAKAWAEYKNHDWSATDWDGSALAALLDAFAVSLDQPDLRSFADIVRLLCLPATSRHCADQRRVSAALAHCQALVRSEAEIDLRAEIAKIVLGWALIAAGATKVDRHSLAVDLAVSVGDARTRIVATAAVAAKLAEQAEEDRALAEQKAKTEPPLADESDDVPEGFVRVCRLSEAERKNPKLKDLVRGHEHVLGENLPLQPVPILSEIRQTLLFEFPYAAEVVDFVLADLVTRTTVLLRPVLLVGPPGGGKSRFARRLGEVLGIGVWRTDASQSDAAVFGGTAKRWYSAEPSHPFLAVSRSRHGNPLVIIDEVEKAATRSDYGRLWNSLLGFLEPETAARYPDPALQTDTNLSQVSFVATANNLTPLPSPLLDRFRVVEFPEPRPEDLSSLLPPVLADVAGERGVDMRWVAPLAAWERELVAARWKGGSIRRLRRFVDAVVRARERNTVKQ